MTISKKFITLFSEFVKSYKTNGTPFLWSWTKDYDHQKICTHLETMLGILKKNQDSFNDSSVINYLNELFLDHAKNNTYVLQCWIQFKEKYRDKMSSNALDNFCIPVNPDENTTQLVQELLNNLQIQQTAFSQTQQAYLAEKTLLMEQMTRIQNRMKEIEQQKHELELQINNQELFANLKKPIEEAEGQLDAFLKLIKTIKTITAEKPHPPEQLSENSSTPTHPLMTEPKPQIIQEKKSDSQNTPRALTENNTNILTPPPSTPIKNAPPPPPPPPPLTPTPKGPQISFLDELARAVEKRNTQEPRPQIEKKK